MESIDLLSLILSIVGLITSIVFATFIFNLKDTSDNISKKQDEINKLVKSLIQTSIADCGCIYPMFSDEGVTDYIIEGRKILDWFKEKHNIEDDLIAINFFKSMEEERLVEVYIKEKESEIKKIFKRKGE